MEPCRSFGRIKPQRLRRAAVLGCVLVPLIVVAFLNSSSHPVALLSFQLSIQTTYAPLSRDKPIDAKQGVRMIGIPVEIKENPADADSTRDTEVEAHPQILKQQLDNSVPDNITVNQRPSNRISDNDDSENFQNLNSTEERENITSDNKIDQAPPYSNLTQEPNGTVSGIQKMKVPINSQVKAQLDSGTSNSSNETGASKPNIEDKHDKHKFGDGHADDISNQPSTVTRKKNDIAPGGKIICDFTEPRSDTCSMYGDIRVIGSSSSLILASSSQPNTTKTKSSWTIRPYARKWESVMENIKKVTLKVSNKPKAIPSCSVTHQVPAVVFSTGGFLGNFFHDFTDVLIPLFITSRQYAGEVQFVVTDFNAKWLKKYKPILQHLSMYEIINMDSDAKVHCFSEAHVGLLSNKVLGIDPTKSPKGYSMDDFRDFLRVALSLKRKTVKRHTRRPRLLILLRKGSRSLTNEREVITMARRSGYKVITAKAEKMKNLTEFAGVVNSCDVMMGVHGAGLTNMVFLPNNATLIQIVPWGAITYGCRNDFGEPAPDMQINYVEYEIKEEESTLIEQYPRDHAVFRDPLAIHRQGFNYIWSIFLNQQRVKLDVRRFRSILARVLQSFQQ